MSEKYTVSFPESDSYVVITFHAPVTRELAFKSASEARVLALDAFGEIPMGYLVDSRGFVNVDTYFDNYEFAAIDSQRPQIDSSGPVAVICSPGDDSHYSVEIAMQHMGIDFRIFTDERVALDWLEEKVKVLRKGTVQ